MKIRNDSLQALQQQGEARAKAKAAETDFTALLERQMDSARIAEGAAAQTQGPGTVPGALSPGVTGIAAPLAAEESGAPALEQVSQSIDALLGRLDAYAASLAAPSGPDLRGAYSLLQSMDGDIKALRQSAPDLGSRHAGLAAMVNELAVITTAETVKLNRGDYL